MVAGSNTLSPSHANFAGFVGAPSPSCGARRMVETSAHLIDHVIPKAPVRQWVLSFPWPLRLLFARQPSTLSRCLAVIIRAIETDIIHRAGLTRASGAQTGIVTLIQRFGSALNLNIHLHMIALDGVYIVGKSGKPDKGVTLDMGMGDDLDSEFEKY